MESYRYQDYIMIALTLFLAMVLTIVPLPDSIVWWRPMWVFMVLFYWMIMEPECVGIGTAFTVGLLMDLLLGTLFGQHALLFSVVAYFALACQIPFRNFPLWQQSIVIFVLALLILLLQYWIMGVLNETVSWRYWVRVWPTLFLWPWVFLALKDYQQRYMDA